MKKSLITFFIIISCGVLHTQEMQHKWRLFSGKWVVSDSIATETNARAMFWDSYELLNYNTIISINPVENFTSLSVTAAISDHMKSPAEALIAFAVTSEDRQWYYHMYAFRLTGGFWGINRASLIYSDRADRSKPMNAKKNTFINELVSSKCSLKYGRMYNFVAAFEGNDVALYIDGEKVLSAPFPEKSHSGRIALSDRYARISVDRVEVKQGDKILFEDDFNEDSIYVKVLKVTRVPSQKEDETGKKPKQK